VKKSYVAAVSAALLACFLVSRPLACTTFCLKSRGEVLFGGNYDWDIGDGLVFVNKRGVAKTAADVDSPNPAKWVSRYGSVTFNQYGRENPMGGMNEAGLVVEVMWLSEAVYPKGDSRPAIGSQEWVQYQLDTSATVGEAIGNAEKVRITSEVKIHFLVSDRAGSAAAVEFINGKLVAHTGDKLAVSTLTNNTYEQSLDFAKNTPPEKATTDGSFDRFARAARKTKDFEERPKTEQDAVNYAFDVLADVAQKGYGSTTSRTQWSIVYDQKRGRIYFRTLQSPQIKIIDTKAFDYSCAAAVKIFDVNSEAGGDVTAKFADYTRRANRDLIERTFGATDFLKDVPAEAKDLAAAYPESFTCGLRDKKARPESGRRATRRHARARTTKARAGAASLHVQ
jgi:penicillin V acylase-like amidase (Ntn superfamily)